TATVAVGTGFFDTNTKNNSATDTDNLTPQADLSIAKSDDVGGSSSTPSTGTAIPGNAITYTIMVSNTGPSDPPGTAVVDSFSRGRTAISYTASATGTASGFTTSGNGDINDTNVTLTAGSSVTYIVHATVKSSATGTLSNTAAVTAGGTVTDTNPNNNSATDTDNLTPRADLSITKSDDVGGSSSTPSTGTAIPGTPITYTIVVSNNGPSDAVGTAVADSFSN